MSSAPSPPRPGPRALDLQPVVIAGSGDGGVPTIRHPVTFSVTPPDYPLPPPPALDQHGDETRAWLAAPAG